VSCATCGDKGLIRLLCDADAPQEYALCLCKAGMDWRCATNHTRAVAPLWHIWAAQHQVPHEQIFLLEDVFTEADLRERGFGQPASSQSREAALLAAGRGKTK
jgi:hypothetical protein